MSAESFSQGLFEGLCLEYQKNNHIDPGEFTRWEVKRGLRNADGTGVVAGITEIANVRGYYIQDGEREPMDGQLIYRGIDMSELIHGFTAEGRFGYAETAYLLLMGTLPTQDQLFAFETFLDANHDLPRMFTEDMILKAPSPDVMNKLARGVLALYSYDDTPEDMTLSSELRRAMTLIARTPRNTTTTMTASTFTGPNRGFPWRKIFSGRCAMTTSLPRRRPSCWICAWYSTPNTAAATTRLSPAGC